MKLPWGLAVRQFVVIRKERHMMIACLQTVHAPDTEVIPGRAFSTCVTCMPLLLSLRCLKPCASGRTAALHGFLDNVLG